MAYDNKEVEIRFSLGEKDFLSVKEKIKNIAKFIKKISQKDTYYTPFHRDFTKPANTRIREWLSIRERGDRAFLNYKGFYPEDAKIFSYCDEFETEIKDPMKMEKIFDSINIRPLIVVKKERETYSNDDFEIAFDNVDELGYFIEVEVISEFSSIEIAKEKLHVFVADLGLDISHQLNIGYPQLLLEKKGIL